MSTKNCAYCETHSRCQICGTSQPRRTYSRDTQNLRIAFTAPLLLSQPAASKAARQRAASLYSTQGRMQGSLHHLAAGTAANAALPTAARPRRDRLQIRPPAVVTLPLALQRGRRRWTATQQPATPQACSPRWAARAARTCRLPTPSLPGYPTLASSLHERSSEVRKKSAVSTLETST